MLAEQTAASHRLQHWTLSCSQQSLAGFSINACPSSFFFWQFARKQRSCLADAPGDSAPWWTLCNTSPADGVTDGRTVQFAANGAEGGCPLGGGSLPVLLARHLLAAVPIMHQPQTQLVQFGTEHQVRVLCAVGRRLVPLDAATASPGPGGRCRWRRRQRLPGLPDLAHLQELQDAFDPPLAEARLGAVAPLQGNLEYGLQAAASNSC